MPIDSWISMSFSRRSGSLGAAMQYPGIHGRRCFWPKLLPDVSHPMPRSCIFAVLDRISGASRHWRLLWCVRSLCLDQRQIPVTRIIRRHRLGCSIPRQSWPPRRRAPNVFLASEDRPILPGDPDDLHASSFGQNNPPSDDSSQHANSPDAQESGVHSKVAGDDAGQGGGAAKTNSHRDVTPEADSGHGAAASHNNAGNVGPSASVQPRETSEICRIRRRRMARARAARGILRPRLPGAATAGTRMSSGRDRPLTMGKFRQIIAI